MQGSVTEFLKPRLVGVEFYSNTLGRNVPKTFILVVKTSIEVPRNYSAIVRGAFD